MAAPALPKPPLFGGPKGRTTTRFLTWLVLVYALAGLQPVFGSSIIDFAWEAAVRRGDLLGLVMLIFIAALCDPDTFNYFEAVLDKYAAFLAVILAFALYAAGIGYLASTRDPRFLTAFFAPVVSVTLTGLYVLISMGVMWARLRHAEANGSAP